MSSQSTRVSLLQKYIVYTPFYDKTALQSKTFIALTTLSSCIHWIFAGLIHQTRHLICRCKDREFLPPCCKNIYFKSEDRYAYIQTALTSTLLGLVSHSRWRLRQVCLHISRVLHTEWSLQPAFENSNEGSTYVISTCTVCKKFYSENLLLFNPEKKYLKMEYLHNMQHVSLSTKITLQNCYVFQFYFYFVVLVVGQCNFSKSL